MRNKRSEVYIFGKPPADKMSTVPYQAGAELRRILEAAFRESLMKTKGVYQQLSLGMTYTNVYRDMLSRKFTEIGVIFQITRSNNPIQHNIVKVTRSTWDHTGLQNYIVAELLKGGLVTTGVRVPQSWDYDLSRSGKNVIKVTLGSWYTYKDVITIEKEYRKTVLLVARGIFNYYNTRDLNPTQTTFTQRSQKVIPILGATDYSDYKFQPSCSAKRPFGTLNHMGGDEK